jgi:hypothetical protein
VEIGFPPVNRKLGPVPKKGRGRYGPTEIR